MLGGNEEWGVRTIPSREWVWGRVCAPSPEKIFN